MPAPQRDAAEVDPLIYERLNTADLPQTLSLLDCLIGRMPADYRITLHDRLGIYRGFVMSPKFRPLPADHLWALTLKRWILADWAGQARRIKNQIETGLTRH